MVFILGDLFEFYHGHGDYIHPFFKGMVDTLRTVAAGRTVYLIEGNHEFSMGEFFEAHTGVRCVESLTINMDDKKVFITHGDELGSPVLRWILKSGFVYFVMDRLGPRLTWKIAMFSRHFLSKSHKPHNRTVMERFRRYGKKKLQEGYDAVIMAHSHIADIEEYEWSGKKQTYMNTGDLIESLSYGVYITGKGFTINRYPRRTS
jgi:UDP-2,3-diacylglucosamine hydrolase